MGNAYITILQKNGIRSYYFLELKQGVKRFTHDGLNIIFNDYSIPCYSDSLYKLLLNHIDAMDNHDLDIIFNNITREYTYTCRSSKNIQL